MSVDIANILLLFTVEKCLYTIIEPKFSDPSYALQNVSKIAWMVVLENIQSHTWLLPRIQKSSHNSTCSQVDLIL